MKMMTMQTRRGVLVADHFHFICILNLSTLVLNQGAPFELLPASYSRGYEFVVHVGRT
jgi:hypothetical protein